LLDSKWTYREKDYAGYKEKRHLPSNHSDEEKAALESLFEQIQILRTSLLKEMGFENIFLIDGFEADDILAFWVSKMHGKRDIIMVTTDADMYQCLTNAAFTIQDLKNHLQKRIYAKPLASMLASGLLQKQLADATVMEFQG
jgi:5'-3' exonuclease